MSEKIIDVRKVIGDKSPRLAKLLPGFIIRYLRRIVHEDEVNAILSEHGHREGTDFLNEVLKYLQVSYEVNGLEKLNRDERYVFASNHPLGGLDGMVILKVIGDYFGSVKAPANDILLNLKPLSPFFVPVNKHGSQSVQSAVLIEETYASQSPVLNFPAGLCSRKQKGQIVDLEWKKSFIVKSVAHKRNVVPMHFQGKNSSFFYNLARIRKFFGIKANLEMLYLADEMFRQRGNRYVITFGEPISFESFNKSQRPAWWANWVKQKTYELAPKP